MAKGIYKRGNVYWIRYSGLDGKIRFESSFSKKFIVAQALLRGRKKKVDEGKEPLPIQRISNHSFKELAENYTELIRNQKSFNSKKYFIKNLVNEFGNMPIRRMTTMVVEQYHSRFLTNGKSPATADRHLAALKHMFTKAVEWLMIEEEILKRIRKVKLFCVNNERLRYLSKEESESLISNCTSHLKPIVIAALNTGMRKGEILCLQWDRNIDLKHGFILLDKTKSGKRREIPINQTFRETLQKQVRHIHSPYVFFNKDGKRYKEVVKSFKSALRRSGIKDFKFHDLRHTFASQLAMAGVDLPTLKELLGHKTLAMTLRYAHLAPSHKQKAVELLDNAVQPKPTIQKTIQLTKMRTVAEAN
jgi:integrase|tara:strand:+ start:682 stop:1764 length:1083 start_codon:yes stop_codon:yes gene_type:complete